MFGYRDRSGNCQTSRRMQNFKRAQGERSTCRALAGASVVSGIATLLVCATGPQTALGMLAATLIAKPPPTAFEIGLRVSELIPRITALMVLFVLTESLWFHRGWLESFFRLQLSLRTSRLPREAFCGNASTCSRRGELRDAQSGPIPLRSQISKRLRISG
ncbi:MAG: hypothetical protein WB999_14825 [Candidatus Binataceae bacterium]